MKIAIFIPFDPAGGSLKSLRQLLGCWSQGHSPGDHTLMVHATRPTFEKLVSGLPGGDRIILDEVREDKVRGWHRLNHERRGAAHQLGALAPDVLYCPGGTIPQGVSAPVVANFQNLLPIQPELWSLTRDRRLFARQLMLRKLLRKSLDRADFVIFNSQFSRQSFERFHGGPLSRATVIPRAMEIPEPDRAAADAQLARLGIDGPFLISIGHIHAYRNYEQLVEGFASYVGASKDDVKLLIVGSPTSRPVADGLNARIAALGISRQVILPGGLPYPETLGLLERATGLLFSSSVENCPNALLEGLAMGVPCISANASSSPEFAKSAALYVDPRDPSQWAAAIGQLRTDPGLRDRLRKAGPDLMAKAPGVAEVAQATWQMLVRASADAGHTEGQDRIPAAGKGIN